jgi:hypothetical protein
MYLAGPVRFAREETGSSARAEVLLIWSMWGVREDPDAKGVARNSVLNLKKAP